MIYKNKKNFTLGMLSLNASGLELAKVRSKTHNIVRRTGFGFVALLFLILNMTFLNFIDFQRASAAVGTILPNTDVTTQWANTGGTTDSSCAGGTHCDFVDEDVQGTPDNNTYVATGSAGASAADAAEEFGMTTISGVDVVSSVTIDINTIIATVGGGTSDNLQIDLRIGGTLQGATTVTPPTGAYAIRSSAAFTGSWTQSDLDGMQVLITRVTQGSGNPTNQRDDVRISAVSARVTYTEAYSTEQSAYQWFENADLSTPPTYIGLGVGEFRNFEATDHAVTPDGGYVVVGGGVVATNGGSAAIAKFNKAGQVQWVRSIGDIGGSAFADRFAGVEVESDGDIIAGGNAYSGATNGNQIFLVKFNSSGVEQWSRTVGSVDSYFGRDLTSTSDGGFLMLSSVNDSSGCGCLKSVVTKFDSAGDDLWSFWLNNTVSEYHDRIIETAAGEAVMVGYNSQFTGVWVTKVSVGDTRSVIWSKTISMGSQGRGYDVVQGGDGSLYVTGSSTTLGGATVNIFVSKLSSSGVEQWTSTLGADNSGYSEYGSRIDLDANEDIFVLSRFNDYAGISSEIGLTKFNNSGVEQWTSTLPWNRGYGTGLTADYNGGILITGDISTRLSPSFRVPFGAVFNTSGTISNCDNCVSQSKTSSTQTVSDVTRSYSTVDIFLGTANQTLTETNHPVFEQLMCGSEISFASSVGTSGFESGEDITRDIYGNLYMVSGGSGNDVMSKFTPEGVHVWSKSLSGVDYNAIDLYQTSNGSGSIVTAGSHQSTSDSIVNNFDLDGVEQSSGYLGLTNIDQYYGVDTNGTSVYAAGYTTSLNAGDMLVSKFDNTGTEQWSITLGASIASSDTAYDIEEESGTVYVAGTLWASGTAGLMLASFNESTGATNWIRGMSTGSAESGRGVTISHDPTGAIDGIIVVGSTNFYGNGSELIMMKFNTSGNEVWTKTLGGTGSEGAIDVVQTVDGGYAVVGSASTWGAGSNDILVSKFSNSGVEEWSTVIGSTNSDSGSGIVATDDGGVAVSGTIFGYGSGSNEAVLFKVDKYGDVANCTAECASVTTSETDRTVTETNYSTVTPTTQSYNDTNPNLTEATASTTITEEYAFVNNLVSTPINVGAQLNSVGQNTATTAPAEGMPFRLRQTVHISTANATDGSFKLQYAKKVGTCDTSFTGESFSDVGSGGAFDFYTGNYAVDGYSIASNVNDPSHSAHTNTLQYYVTANNFNLINATTSGDDALWDFALIDNGADSYESYCFRIVTSGGGLLNTYTVVPEITTQGPLLEQSGYRWFENTDSVAGASTWVQTWGGSSDSDIAYDTTLTSDGGFVVVGITDSYGSGFGDQFLVKYNSSGVEQWSKTWGGVERDIPGSVQETSDGGFIVVGSTGSYGSGNNGSAPDQSLVKYSSSGIEQWSKTWGGSLNAIGVSDFAESVKETSDGGFIVAGLTFNYGAGSFDQSLVKYSSSGIEQWSKTWGGTGVDYAYDVELTSDGGYIVAGMTVSYGAGGADQSLVKYSSSGIEQWSKTWGGSSEDYANNVEVTSDGGYVVVGYTTSAGLTAGSSDQTLVKYNSSGIEQWSKTWGGTGSDRANSVKETSDGGFIVVGNTSSFGAGSNDLSLVKYNSSGIEQWSKTWGGTDVDSASSVQETSDGSFIVVGNTSSFGAGSGDSSILKFDNNGDIANCTSCQTQTVTEVDRTVTEADQTVTEADQTVTEADQTVTEADQNVQTLVHCGVVGSFFHTWGGTSSDLARAVATDSSDNVYVAGYTQSAGFTAGSNDQSLVKYNSSGVEQWSKTWGGTGFDEAYGIDVDDNNGDIYIVGGSNSTGFNSGGSDQTLVKFNSSGVEQWTKTWGGNGTDIAYAVKVDSSSNIYVVGNGDSTGLTAGGLDQTLVKYDSSGVEQWSKTWGGTGSDSAWALELDDAGNIYVSGETNSVGFTAGGIDQTLVKYNSSGVEQWSKTWGGNGTDAGYGVVLDASGNIYVSGTSSSTGFTAGLADQLLVKYNSSGVEQWSKTWGGTGNDFAVAIDIDGDGNMYTTGYATGTGLAVGGVDVSLVKYNSSGVEQWTKTWGDSGNDLARGLILDSTQTNVYIVGQNDSTGLTAGGFDQNLIKIDVNGNSCGGICTDRATSEVDRATSEVDRVTSEVDRATSEVDRTNSEVDRVTVEVRRNESTILSSGNALASLNTNYQMIRGDEPLRLRLLLNTTTSPKFTNSNAVNFKIQYARKIGTCDASFTGENYADVTTNSFVSFYDNPSVTDGTTTGLYLNDPSYNSYSAIGQSYEEANNFTNATSFGGSTSNIWDLALTPNAAVNGTYCMRVVFSDGSLLSAYNQIIELDVPTGTSQQMRHGSFFDAETEGTKQSFYW